MKNIEYFDLIVIGGGHAGIEAAWAGSRLKIKTAMLTMETNAIGRMSCNPAIGGVAKGQIVRDIDALGGLMGVLADKAGIQFRVLNRSKGPAVWGPRAQEDMDLYAEEAQRILKDAPNLTLIDGELARFEKQEDQYHIETLAGQKFICKTLVVTTGTFLGAIMHTGLNQTVGGRIGEASSDELSDYLINKLGVKTRRLKTGTPPRLSAASIDFDQTEIQFGDQTPLPFSFRTQHELKNFANCWITRTELATHKILESGFDRSPLFTGVISGFGPRYCPSIEDKISRFADKDSHQLFLEPEGLNNDRIYVNGFSSSLPVDIQEAAIRTIPGLQNCEILRHAYAVEYDAIDSTQLYPTMELKKSEGLYFAGQVCGTSGYEEAAGQGLIAGVNAALKVLGKDPLILGRADSYIGVMVDDLTTLDILEPYRMFTSRAEYRLFLRQDNAENRLIAKGLEVGLATAEDHDRYVESRAKIDEVKAILNSKTVSPALVNPYLESVESNPLANPVKAHTLIKRPNVDLKSILELCDLKDRLNRREILELFSEELYAGFFERQARDIEKQKKMESFRIPKDFDYDKATAMSMEARNKLKTFQPLTVGQAQKVAGVRQSDISILIYLLDNKPDKKKV